MSRCSVAPVTVFSDSACVCVVSSVCKGSVMSRCSVAPVTVFSDSACVCVVSNVGGFVSIFQVPSL